VLKLTRLRDRRLDLGLSQEQLEEKSGVSRTTIIKIEAGRECWPATATKLAKALHTRVSELR
jgi:transcriptional regulator with XRE-family HTH domain